MKDQIFIFSPSSRPPLAHSLRTRSAFTLIEILAVVVIMGIASAIIVPQLSNRNDMRCAAAARALMADLLYAQNRSIALQVRHYVQFNTATNTYQIMADSGTGSPGSVITHPVNGSPYTVTLGNGSLANVTLGTVNFDNNTTIAFDSVGIPYSWSASNGTLALNSGTVVMQAGTNKLTVSVGAYSGEITVH